MSRKGILLIVLIALIVIGGVCIYYSHINVRWIRAQEIEDWDEFNLGMNFSYVNISDADIENFPHLLETIETQEAVKITEEEYGKLKDFLDDTWFIKWDNKHYEIQLRMS